MPGAVQRWGQDGEPTRRQALYTDPSVASNPGWRADWGPEVVPLFKARGIRYKMNVTGPDGHWNAVHRDWRPAPYGSMDYALDYLPGGRNFFVVFNHFPAFEYARTYLDRDHFLYNRAGGYGEVKKELNENEWRWLVRRAKELMPRHDPIPVGYDHIAEYARSKVDTQILDAAREGRGDAVRVVLQARRRCRSSSTSSATWATARNSGSRTSRPFRQSRRFDSQRPRAGADTPQSAFHIPQLEGSGSLLWPDLADPPPSHPSLAGSVAPGTIGTPAPCDGRSAPLAGSPEFDRRSDLTDTTQGDGLGCPFE